MAVDYDFKKGTDVPTWQWLSFFVAGPSYHGSASTYDGKRYMYWAIQFGSAGTAVSTANLYRYDTWTNSWQFLNTLTNSNRGLDIEYDPVRNVLYIIHGGATTTGQIFNLNKVPVTTMNVTVAAFTIGNMVALPVAADYGASITMPDDLSLPTQIDSGTADSTGNTTTVVKATDATGTFGPGMIGLQLRVTSGTQNNVKRIIGAVTDKNTLTLSAALSGPLAADDTFVIEPVQDQATSGTTTTISNGNSVWPTNQYADHDVIILSGTGAGQRRRVTSNTATTMTLSAATTGNARTGAWTTAPDNTSVYKIVPSSDFLYYNAGNGSTALYRIDVAQTTGVAWSSNLGAAPGTIGPGSNTFYPGAYAPSFLLALRGATTNNVYLFNIGTKTWSNFPTFAAGETFTTGNTSCMLHGKRKLLVQKEGTTRLYVFDLTTGELEAFATMPYAAPAVYDGKRARYIKTADGTEWLYIMRAGGQEFFRVAIEWL